MNNNGTKITALVLAASRKGVEDPVAKIQNCSHKCLVEIDGIPMVQRVVQTLLDTDHFDKIYISIENEEILKGLESTRLWLEEGKIEIIPSHDNLADTVISLADSHLESLPMLITAGDNALHTPELIDFFVQQFLESDDDVAIAATHDEIVLSDYPSEGIGFFRFRDGGYSFCNLYGVKTVKGINAAKIFRSGGQFRKRPWRILQVFGILPLIIYKWRLASLDTCLNKIAGKLGISISTIILPFPYAPIDVDDENSYAISESILKQRRKS